MNKQWRQKFPSLLTYNKLNKKWNSLSTISNKQKLTAYDHMLCCVGRSFNVDTRNKDKTNPHTKGMWGCWITNFYKNLNL